MIARKRGQHIIKREKVRELSAAELKQWFSEIDRIQKGEVMKPVKLFRKIDA
jgi:hypothetical protein